MGYTDAGLLGVGTGSGLGKMREQRIPSRKSRITKLRFWLSLSVAVALWQKIFFGVIGGVARFERGSFLYKFPLLLRIFEKSDRYFLR